MLFGAECTMLMHKCCSVCHLCLEGKTTPVGLPLTLIYLLCIDCLACLVLQAWVASQFSGFKVQLGDILSGQLADALAAERTKTDTDIAQVGKTCIREGFTARRLHLNVN